MNKTKKVIYKSAFVILGLVGVLNLVDGIYAANSTSAAQPEPPLNSFRTSATIQPSSTMSLSANSVALDIVPSEDGTFKSDYLTVSAYTNSTTTCTVTMRTESTDLTSGNETIPTLTSAVAEASFVSDRWGYRAGSSGNFNPVGATNTIATITSNTGTTASTTDVYFGAKLSAATKPGTYTGKVIFISTCAGQSLNYMQDQTAASLATLMPNEGSSTILYDKRDDKSYTVKKINGQYWMTQNLRVTGTVSASLSNFTGDDFNVSEYSLASADSSYTGHCDSTNGYNYACAKDSGSTTTGVWYNFYAASAGTISTDSNSTAATSDICPAGWHLPTGLSTIAGTDFNILVGNTTSFAQDPTAGLTAFSAVAGGYYLNGSLGNTGGGGYWSATGNATARYGLYYNSSTGQFTGNDIYTRYTGHFIRCVSDFDAIMQNQTASTLAALMPNNGDSTTLYDKRDGKPYTVAKLADGNYWMTQNLDHDIKTDGTVTYNSTTTDIPAAWTPSAATFATGTTTWATGTTGYTTPQSYDPGDLCWDGTINSNFDGTLSNETAACGSDKHMHIGNYYNWTAAVAMNDSSSYTTQNTDADQSICPAGWRLPISGTTNTGSKSFQYLWNQYSGSFTDSTMMNSPLYFSYAGGWGGSSSNVGSLGYYWSSVVGSSSRAYGLYFGTVFGVYPQGSLNRSNGYSIRCVAR